MQRHGQPLSVVMFDVDHFKQVNDTHGHAAGDVVLQRIGRVVMELVRNEDVVCRYGGEEFVCILRGLTLDQGQLFADRGVRRTIEAQVIAAVSTCCGRYRSALRRYADEFPNPEEMINEADAYLYVAKEGGRIRSPRRSPPPHEFCPSQRNGSLSEGALRSSSCATGSRRSGWRRCGHR